MVRARVFVSSKSIRTLEMYVFKYAYAHIYIYVHCIYANKSSSGKSEYAKSLSGASLRANSMQKWGFLRDEE